MLAFPLNVSGKRRGEAQPAACPLQGQRKRHAPAATHLKGEEPSSGSVPKRTAPAAVMQPKQHHG
eukprot:7757947-Alexandrium_andersonii.AAC.1